MSEAANARRLLGESAALWAGDGHVRHTCDGWAALSGARSVDYNVVLCDGPGEALDGAVERILETGLPTVVMVAGRALGEVQRLVTRNWACIGQTPVMCLTLDQVSPPVDDAPPEVRRLDRAEDLAAARALVAKVFEVSPELSKIAIPGDAIGGADRSLWGALDESGQLRACLAVARCQDAVVVWSMATDRALQGRGYGRAALSCALASAAAAGAARSLLYASAAGEPFYARLGYRVVERWQMWSRPRWVLGRA